MNGRWYLVFSRFSEEVGTIYRVADSPRGPFRVPAREDLGGRRWYAAKSAPQPDGSRVFFGWLHDFVTEGDRPRWLWGGDFAAPRVVTADPSGDLKVTLHPAVASWFAEAENNRIALAGVGGEAHSALGPVLPATARVTAEFSLPQSPAALGLALVGTPDLEGWFVTINRKRGLVSLSQEPRPLDDFWADLTGRPGAYREIDGPIVAQATIDGDRDSHRVTVLLDGEVLEVYVDDEVALTHRVRRATPLRPVAFVVDGDTEVVLGVSKPLST
jgi:beta-fructofuranosidase